jgi:hypothetical protein
MSASNLLTLGLGSFSSVNYLTTLGLGAFSDQEPELTNVITLCMDAIDVGLMGYTRTCVGVFGFTDGEVGRMGFEMSQTGCC